MLIYYGKALSKHFSIYINFSFQKTPGRAFDRRDIPQALTLFPGQTRVAPAAGGTAPALAIANAFKALEDIEYEPEPGLRRQSCRRMGAHCASAQQENEVVPAAVDGQFVDEARVGLAARIAIPFNQDALGDAADVMPLGMGAHIDNPRAMLRELVRLARRHGSGIGQTRGYAAFGGANKNLFENSNWSVHGIPIWFQRRLLGRICRNCLLQT
jgi:hypothetical protein